MSMNIRATIEDLTPQAVAAASGFPYSTIYRWMRNDMIPGQGTAFELRRERLVSAVQRLRADQTKPRKTKKRKVS